jgi:hypothetical protein
MGWAAVLLMEPGLRLVAAEVGVDQLERVAGVRSEEEGVEVQGGLLLAWLSCRPEDPPTQRQAAIPGCFRRRIGAPARVHRYQSRTYRSLRRHLRLE